MEFKLKRYVITIAFVIIITLCIGIFYIHAADNRYPEYILMKQQGNEEEAKEVFLQGIYNENYHVRMSPGVTIGLEGSQYASEQSFFERIDPHSHSHEEIKKFVKNHRKFMRGKGGAYNSFYDDDHLLVYANVESDFTTRIGQENFRFDVAVLDKNQNESWSYELSLPDSNLYHYINVYDVQVYGDEIAVLTRNQNRNSNGSEFHRYSLSLKSENMTNMKDEIIEFSFPENLAAENSDEAVNHNIQIVPDSNITSSNRYNIFFAAQIRNVEPNDQTVRAEPVNRNQTTVHYQEIVSAKIMIYDLQTNQWVTVNTPEIIDFLDVPLDVTSLNTKLEGNQLYLTKHSDQIVSVIEYSIPDEKITLYEVKEEFVVFSEVKNDRIYMLTKDDKDSINQPLLKIVDLVSGGKLYQGSIEIIGAGNNEADVLNRLNIHRIIIK
jgi:hypothetical protein